jgi:hypothetical protein
MKIKGKEIIERVYGLNKEIQGMFSSLEKKKLLKFIIMKLKKRASIGRIKICKYDVKTIQSDTKFMIQKRFWKSLNKHGIELFDNDKEIRFIIRNWHIINKYRGVSLNLKPWDIINNIEHKGNSYLQ